MHPITAAHDWIAHHPITFELLLTVFVGGSISVYGNDIKQFLKIPPQRLGIWILKSRLASTEQKIRRIQGMKQNLHLFIATGLMAVLSLVFSVLAVLNLDLVIVLRTLNEHVLKADAENYLFLGAAAAGFAYTGTKTFKTMFLLFETAWAQQSVPRLQRKVIHLRDRAGLPTPTVETDSPTQLSAS